MKKSLLLLTIVALLFTGMGTWWSAPLAASTPPIRVLVNGRQLTLDVDPVIQSGRTLVPFRAIFEALGAQVDWNATSSIVSGYLGRRAILLEPGKTGAWVNGAPTTLSVAPSIIGGRTMVPLRFVAESLGAEVTWLDTTRTVVVQMAAVAASPRGGTLTRGSIMEPDNLNPIFANNNIGRWVTTITNLGLVRLDETQTPVNALADRWAWDQNTLTYRFSLRPGVRWSDDRPFTAADVKFTFDTIMDATYTGPRRGDFAALASVTIIDPLTVDFKLSRIDAPFLTRMTIGIIPQHAFANVPVAQMGAHAFSRNPIGIGPFKLDRWVSGQFLAFSRNANFPLEVALLDQMTLRIYRDNDVMALAWENGELDWHTGLPSASATRLIAEFDKTAYFKELNISQYEFLRPNMGHPFLSDRRVRQALMYGLDRPAMINSLLDGRAVLMNGHQLPSSWAFKADLYAYPFNRTRATQLLNEAGWRTVGADGIRRNANGDRLSFTLLTTAGNTLRADMAAFMENSWRRIGVEMRTDYVTFPVLLNTHLNQSRFDMVLLAPGMDADPDPHTYFHSTQGFDETRRIVVGRNNGNWRSAEFDRLIEQGRSTVNFTERRAIYHQLEILVNQQLPFLPILTTVDVHGIHNRIQGIVWSSTGPIYPELVFVAR